MLTRIGLIMIALTCAFSQYSNAAPQCNEVFEQALAKHGIKGPAKTVSRDSQDVRARLEGYRDQMTEVVRDLLKSLGIAMKDIEAPTRPSDPKNQEAMNQYFRDQRNYDLLRKGEPALKAARMDARYIRASTAYDKLAKENQFDELNDYLTRDRSYNQVTTIGPEADPDAAGFIRDGRLVGFRFKDKANKRQVLTVFEPNSCETKILMIERAYEKSRAWSYVTPKFCASGPALRKLAADLVPWDQEYENICRFQGGQPPGCQCSGKKYINPWADSCYPERRLTAKDKLYAFIRQTNSVVWESKEGVETALQDCEKHLPGAKGNSSPPSIPLNDGAPPPTQQ
jgi:hypothetical protein